MSGFIEWLEKISKEDAKVRAILRRSLSFDPGTFVPAYPYVEPFLRNQDESAWRRKVFYLVAGVWAAHWREDRKGPSLRIGQACANHQNKSASTENRFIALLDADPDQLPHRLRQMMALLRDRNIDFEDLLTGLIYWNTEQRFVQNRWARDFYGSSIQESPQEHSIEKEISE